MLSLFFIAFASEAKQFKIRNFNEEVKSNNCLKQSKIIYRNSLFACIKGPYSLNRLTFGECNIWAMLDSNDYYYVCVVKQDNFN
jgi:hypothetical protein